MKWQDQFKHPVVRTLNRLLNMVVLIFGAVLLSTHGAYAWQAHANAERWEERVFIIEREWQFKLLHPLIGSGIGFALPPLSVAYVSQEAATRLGTDVEGVRRHEAKHLEQVSQLGLFRYYQLDEWQREGIAEYVRGGPTIRVCAPDPDENPHRLAYRAYYVVTRYLIEEKGLTEDELYKFESYPLDAAEEWLSEKHCS